MIDLAHDRDARRARKRGVSVAVVFAAAPGELLTREGKVRYAAGDALVTGPGGDRWPVPRAHLDLRYEPVAPTRAGTDGTYRARPGDVWAKRMDVPFTVPLSGGRGALAGAAGDWLVQYAAGDCAVVAAQVFAATYELVD